MEKRGFVCYTVVTELLELERDKQPRVHEHEAERNGEVRFAKN